MKCNRTFVRIGTSSLRDDTFSGLGKLFTFHTQVLLQALVGNLECSPKTRSFEQTYAAVLASRTKTHAAYPRAGGQQRIPLT